MVGDNGLIVVSNRLPFVLKKEGNTWQRKASAGGLVTAVAPIVIESKGLWVGWPGVDMKDGEAIPESARDDVSPTAGLKSDHIVPVSLGKDDHDLYYNGMCNATLWPLFHSMSDRAVIDPSFFKAYKRINEDFAIKTVDALAKMSSASPEKHCIVWIHDYHLLLAANRVREIASERGLNCLLAFFLHIPWPAYDIFRIMPWSKQLLEGVLGCDVIGFHDDDYCVNFLDCCHRLKGYLVAKNDKGEMLVEKNDGRVVSIKEMPISIPYQKFKDMALSSKQGVVKEGVRNILGVDRLDYTKGIPNKLRAYKELLDDFPEHRGKVTLTQVAVPSRVEVKEYQDLKEQVDGLVQEINDKYATSEWVPVRYTFGSVPQSDLAGLYRDANVVLITALRDGMNLVAKEFVACQVKKDDPGVLVLSPFAGAGKHMKEALLANPYETSCVTKALHRALTMPLRERTVRMQALQAREETHDVNNWMKMFLNSVDQFIELKENFETKHNKDFEEVVGPMLRSKTQFALLLDFDGTLAPIASHPDLATMPRATKEVLAKLKSFPNVFIAVISGRRLDEIKSKVGLDGIAYSGSHGHAILSKNGILTEAPRDQRLDQVEQNIKENITDKNQGSWVENKGHTLCVHTRHVAPENIDHVNSSVTETAKAFGLQVFKGHCSLEVKPPNAPNKGTAVLKILNDEFGQDWEKTVCAIYVGDDTTDEDAMSALRGKGVSFRVVENKSDKVTTAADRTVEGTRSVAHLLHWFRGQISKKVDPMPPKSPTEKEVKLDFAQNYEN